MDNSAAIRKLIGRALRQAGVAIGDVFEAADGMEALHKLAAQPVGLVFSGINMPKMDGFELLGRLKGNELWKDVPVIMVSADASRRKVLEAAQLGAAGYLRKPFTSEQVKLKLAGILGN